MAQKDISSMKFGMLTAISFSGKNRHGKSIWQCRCDCGGSALVLIGSLMSGNSTSCGCKTKIARSAYVAEKKKNGFGVHHERARNTWRHMIDRCTNEKHQDFASYGARGISVCLEWLDFKAFVMDMGDPPPGKTIDRIDTNGNYEPSNCRWATPVEQARNTRKNVLVEHGGKLITVAELSVITGIPAPTIYSRIARGASPV